ncbi:MAG: methionyl-tRNA formyltransferase [Candidatus Pacebacteria bacterium]|nr:methionyl-tRNA formyltransferase [Candidatus Paceibacterota bacterium]
MKYVFFGSPEFAATILKKLTEAGYMPEAIVCNPDEPVGRKKIITPPAVKQLAISNNWNIKILQPKKLSDIKDDLKKINADVFIVAAYAKIISKEILEMPNLKTIGVHPSILPKYRGSSPIQSAILNGEEETGVSIFIIDEKVDHGPVLAISNKQKIAGENYPELSAKLADLGGGLLVKILPDYLNGKIKPQTQSESDATFTQKFSTKDGEVDLKKDSPKIIFGKVKALNPDPGVFTYIETKKGRIRLKILDAELENNNLKLLQIQPDGKKPMAYKEFLNGYKPI